MNTQSLKSGIRHKNHTKTILKTLGLFLLSVIFCAMILPHIIDFLLDAAETEQQWREHRHYTQGYIK